VAVSAPESRFPLITGIDANSMVRFAQVKLGVDAGLRQPVKDLPN
jgi:hypothetical protein